MEETNSNEISVGSIVRAKRPLKSSSCSSTEYIMGCAQVATIDTQEGTVSLIWEDPAPVSRSKFCVTPVIELAAEVEQEYVPISSLSPVFPFEVDNNQQFANEE